MSTFLQKCTDGDLTGFSRRNTDWWKLSLQLRCALTGSHLLHANSKLLDTNNNKLHNVLSIRRVKHCAKRFPSHNRYDGLCPVYRRGSRGSGRGGALPRSQDSKTSGTDCRKVKDLSQLPVGLQQMSRGGEFRVDLQPLGQNPRSGGTGARRTRGRAFQVPTSKGGRTPD